MQYIACEGKVPHDSYDEARKHIDKPYRSGQHDKLPRQKLDIYRCPYCFKWHVGKTLVTRHVRKRSPPYKRARLRYEV